MGGTLEPQLAELSPAEARSLLAWWLEAGVDTLAGDEPRDRLRPEPPRPAAAAPGAASPPPPANVAVPAHETLVEIQQWLASSLDLPLAGATARRVLPHGPEDAAVMLVSDSPTLEDFNAGQPIGGAAWQLATRMLAAIAVPSDQAYSASLSCFNTPGSRMSADDRKQCADIARRHIRLVRPKRLLLLGDGPCQALLGKPLAQARGSLHSIEGVRTIATFHPRFLINEPSKKALAWKDLLLLMEPDA